MIDNTTPQQQTNTKKNDLQAGFEANVIVVANSNEFMQGIIRAIEKLDYERKEKNNTYLQVGIIHGISTGIIDDASSIIAQMANAVFVAPSYLNLPTQDRRGNKIYSVSIDMPEDLSWEDFKTGVHNTKFPKDNSMSGKTQLVIDYITEKHSDLIERIVRVSNTIPKKTIDDMLAQANKIKENPFKEVPIDLANNSKTVINKREVKRNNIPYSNPIENKHIDNRKD